MKGEQHEEHHQKDRTRHRQQHVAADKQGVHYLKRDRENPVTVNSSSQWQSAAFFTFMCGKTTAVHYFSISTISHQMSGKAFHKVSE